MADYQMPLFCYFPIEVEFNRRREYMQAALDRKWHDLRRRIHAEVVGEVGGCVEISPLELHLDEMAIEEIGPSGINVDTREQCYRFDCRVPYSGDDMLWNLNPGLELKNFPDGEIFRGELVLDWVSSSRDEAVRGIEAELSRIELLISVQKRLIEDFHNGVSRWIAEQTETMRQRDAWRAAALTVH